MCRFLHPLTYGDYPQSMKSLVGDRLPKFTKSESQMLKQYSFDYLGINYYTALYAATDLFFNSSNLSITTDDRAIKSGMFENIVVEVVQFIPHLLILLSLRNYYIFLFCHSGEKRGAHWSTGNYTLNFPWIRRAIEFINLCKNEKNMGK